MREKSTTSREVRSTPIITEVPIWRGRQRGLEYRLAEGGHLVVRVVAGEVIVEDAPGMSASRVVGDRHALAAWAELCAAWRGMHDTLAWIGGAGTPGRYYGRSPLVHAEPGRRPRVLRQDDPKLDELRDAVKTMSLATPRDPHLGGFAVVGDVVTGGRRDRLAVLLRLEVGWALALRNELMLGGEETPSPEATCALVDRLRRGTVDVDSEITAVRIDEYTAAIVETAARAGIV